MGKFSEKLGHNSVYSKPGVVRVHHASSILDKKLGSKLQIGCVADVTHVDAEDKYGLITSKLVLEVVLSNEQRVLIDEAFVRVKRGELKIHGLWIKFDANDNINPMSTLGKLMTHLGVEFIRDLVGREVLLFPKANDYMAIVAASDFDEGIIKAAAAQE